MFLAFDLLLVAGLAFHGLNGLRVALVGSGLLVDRHRALLVAAAILVGLVGGRGRAHPGPIEEGPMATQINEDFTEATRWRRRPRPSFAWVAQVVSGCCCWSC